MNRMNRCDTDLMKTMKKRLDDRGTTLVEYGLILLLIAVIVIVGIKMVGESTNNLFCIANSEITNAGQK